MCGRAGRQFAQAGSIYKGRRIGQSPPTWIERIWTPELSCVYLFSIYATVSLRRCSISIAVGI